MLTKTDEYESFHHYLYTKYFGVRVEFIYHLWNGREPARWRSLLFNSRQ